MPHQCVRCGQLYDDGAKEILEGCPCGARLFFYIKKAKLEEAQKIIEQELPAEQKQQIEQDVLDMVGSKADDLPVILDFESIRVKKPGSYEIDLIRLFQNKPVIFKLEEGKYVIDIAESFDRLRKKNK